MRLRKRLMPREIEGIRYFTVSEIERKLRVSRQTLWRWRREGNIPAGQRFRSRQVVFTEAEVEKIRGFANRLTPIGLEVDETPLPLFPNG